MKNFPQVLATKATMKQDTLALRGLDQATAPVMGAGRFFLSQGVFLSFLFKFLKLVSFLFSFFVCILNHHFNHMTDRIAYLKQYYQNNKPAYRQRAKKFREKKKKEDQDWVDRWRSDKAKVA